MESNVADPMFEIDDVTRIEKHQESVEEVPRPGHMVPTPTRKKSVQTSQDTTIISFESVSNEQSQAQVPMCDTG